MIKKLQSDAYIGNIGTDLKNHTDETDMRKLMALAGELKKYHRSVRNTNKMPYDKE